MSNSIDTLVEQIATICLARSLKIVTAESCTGGGVAYALTSVPGSSKWFERGFVTYSNDAKIEMLGVNKNTIDSFGAVSEQVAMEMAEGAIKNSHGNVSIAITGIAGPAGGTAEKPVGTCWFSFASSHFPTIAEQHLFARQDRQTVRSNAVLVSLTTLVQLLKG